MTRKIAAIVSLVFISLGVVGIFWFQEIQYTLPTPMPNNHVIVPLGTKITTIPALKNGALKLIHFYNPNCPCSKFNSKHIKELQLKYAGKVQFYVVTEMEVEKAYNEFGCKIILDSYGKFADACGVFATPQAVILDSENKLYYRGNYNKERYCTDKESNFAELALLQLLESEHLEFKGSATSSVPYGCQLMSDI